MGRIAGSPGLGGHRRGVARGRLGLDDAPYPQRERLQHALDVTTSRTLMGHAYSMPGLHAKYYDQDFEPLIEVVQDTVGSLRTGAGRNSLSVSVCSGLTHLSRLWRGSEQTAYK